MMQTLTGIFPAMFTPMSAPDRFDEDGIRKLVSYLLDGGVQGLFVLGSCGEFPVFSAEERADIISIVRDAAGSATPILAGTSGVTTRQTIRHTSLAAERGADVAVVLPPFYFGSSQAEIIAHFDAILNETEIPLLIYNNPFSTQTKIEIGTLKSLSGHPQVVGIKDSTSDFAFHQDLLAALWGTPTKVFQGDERLAAASFLAGCDGGTLGLASLAPRVFVDIYEHAVQRDIEGAFAAQQTANALLEIFEVRENGGDGGFFAAAKAALQLLGVCADVLSRPFARVTADELARVESILKRHRLL